MNINADELKARCKKMFEVTERPVTRFCRTIPMSTAAYYKWVNGILKLSEPKLEAINNELINMGF